MKFSLKTIAAAVALATVAAGAHAKIATSTTAGTGSDLVLFTYSAGSGYVTGMFDLGLSFDSIVTSAGVINSAFTTNAAGPEIVWDLKNNTVGGNYGSSAAYVGATTGSWSTGLAEFKANTAGQTDIRWAVIGVSKKSGSDIRALSTSNALLSKVDDTTKSSVAAFSNVFDLFAAPHNLIDSNAIDAVGSSAGNSGAQKASTSFGTAMDWNTKASFNATAADKASANFFYLDTTSPTTGARVLQLKDQTLGMKANFTFDSDAGTLVFAVPEPESYAMFLAGLGLIGAMARRRRFTK